MVKLINFCRKTSPTVCLFLKFYGSVECFRTRVVPCITESANMLFYLPQLPKSQHYSGLNGCFAAVLGDLDTILNL